MFRSDHRHCRRISAWRDADGEPQLQPGDTIEWEDWLGRTWYGTVAAVFPERGPPMAVVVRMRIASGTVREVRLDLVQPCAPGGIVVWRSGKRTTVTESSKIERNNHKEQNNGELQT